MFIKKTNRHLDKMPESQKIQAFLNMQKNFDSDIVTNIICLGDSFIEMEAGHTLAGQFQ